MEVKICGLTRREDAELAVSLGATRLGWVVVPETPRAVTAAEARDLTSGLDATPVLVTRDTTVAQVLGFVEESGITTVQLHRFREEVAAPLEDAGLRVIRGYDATESDAVEAAVAIADRGLEALLDVGGGGSGRRFDWTQLAGRALSRIWVAGGITPDNIHDLLHHRPHGVDVSSGVESAPGIKDHALMTRLFTRIREASGSLR